MFTPTPVAHALARLEVFHRDVLAPAVDRRVATLNAEAFVSLEPVPYAAAVDSPDYRPVELGWEWGPKWSTAWFRLRGSAPRRLTDGPLRLRFSTDTEALLWIDGVPHHGLDPNRETAELPPAVLRDGGVTLHVEAACNHPFGAEGLQWDTADVKRRWGGGTPGRFLAAELVERDEAAWRLAGAFAFAMGVVREAPAESVQAHRLLAALSEVVARLGDAPARWGAGAAAEAAGRIEAAIGRADAAVLSRCHAVGHAHIDTAWLWPLRETRRKCLRTFANVLRLMERYPGFVFLCSQAQQYAFVEEDAPGLFAQIRARVAEGRWEPGGAMWVEPDCNAASGESLCRQILHGTRYWREKFGERGRQSFVYLPDTFGFPASLPQILAHAGLTAFITNKLHWNQTNVWPLTTWRWRGIDGTEILAHNTPAGDYNATMTPRELRRGDLNHKQKHLTSADGAGRAGGPRWLQPFGFGDGGGGPTEEMLLAAALAKAGEGLPAVQLSTVREFVAGAEADRAILAGTPEGDYPVWDGELYLELHRGTLTSQAWLKKANREAEDGLRLAELLLTAAAAACGEAVRPRGELDRAWKLVLLNQFHDILPGSSIDWVYRDAQGQHAEVAASVERAVGEGVEAWAGMLDARGAREPLGVINPASTARAGVVEHAGRLHWVQAAPACGARVVDLAEASAVRPAAATPEGRGVRLSNGVVDVAVQADGGISSLQRVGGAPLEGARLNDLVLAEDRPRLWDAWDLDGEYEHSARPVSAGAGVVVEAASGLRAVVRVERACGERSRIVQRFVLDAGAPLVRVETEVEWRERHRVLRMLARTPIRAGAATYQVQFGHHQRATHRNTTWERARFEAPGMRWVDLSEPGRGLAVLNDCKYGHSCHEGTIGLTLLRAPTYPDAEADQGVHRFTYAFMPHGGDLRAAGVEAEAEAMCRPLRAVSLRAGEAGRAGPSWSAVEVTPAPGQHIAVEAVKPAEDGSGRVVVRLVETHGVRGTARVRWGFPAAHVQRLNLLEEPADGAVGHDAAGTTLALRPFEIVTLGVRGA